MFRKFVFSLATITLASAPVFAANFMPENDLHLEDNINKDSNVTEEQFNAIIDQAEELYSPIIQSHGGMPFFNRLWDDDTVNASAIQLFGFWVVNMYGGLARRDEVTPDGFALVLCHEIGHHLAGFPYVQAWAANEGQSDYFATQSCARRLWGNETEINAESADIIPDTPKAKCDEQWETEDERNLCYRSMMAGKSLADLLGALKEETVSFDEQDENVVDATDNEHPAAQCRLDTYTAGALCTMDFDFTIIPSTEAQSAEQTCTRSNGYDVQTRPLCWFKPGN